ncbi:MAG: RDD family protein [Pseudomonadota bacterium]
MHDPALAPVFAPFRKRFYAYGYDSLIVTVLAIFVGYLLGGIAHAQTAEDINTLVEAGLLPPGTDINTLTSLTSLSGMLGQLIDWRVLVVPFFTSAIYNIFFLTGSWQATPGKRFCGIYVTTAAGGRLTLPQSTARHVASGLSMLLSGLGFLTIFFTREKLALHDMICHTRVVIGKTNL